MRTPFVLLDEIIVSDESGFACSKTKLVEDGLIHLRPFNLANDGTLSFDQLYRVPPEGAPKGKRMLEEGDILFNNTNSAELVGKAALVEQAMEAGFSNHMTRIRVNRARVIPQWVTYWLRWMRSTGHFSEHATQWVSQAAFKSSELRRMAMPLPSAEEQRRLVDVLSRAEGIVRLRREAQKKAAELIPALFLDRFGYPATNPKGWPVFRLGDIAEVVSGVTKGRKFNGKQTVTVPYLRVANVQAGFLDLTELKEIEVLPSDVKQLTLQYGDVLLTEGGDYDKLGRGALWVHDIPNCIHQNHIFRVRLKKGMALSEFFVTYLQMQHARNYFLRSAKRTTNLASINITQLRGLPVVLPPVDVQSIFVSQFEQIRSIHAQQATATEKAEATFNALLSHTFSTGIVESIGP